MELHTANSKENNGLNKERKNDMPGREMKIKCL